MNRRLRSSYGGCAVLSSAATAKNAATVRLPGRCLAGPRRRMLGHLHYAAIALGAEDDAVAVADVVLPNLTNGMLEAVPELSIVPSCPATPTPLRPYAKRPTA